MIKELKSGIFQVFLALGLPLLALVLLPLTMGGKPFGPVEAAPGVGPPFQPAARDPVGARLTSTPVLSPTAVFPPIDDSGNLFPQSAAPEPGLCGVDSEWLVLLIGSDSRDGGFVYGLADAIRVVRLDFAAGRVSVLSLPRDLWVEIPAISDHFGITHGKLNQAFLYGGPGMGYFDGPEAGRGLLALTLEQNFGLEVERTLAVDMATFVGIIDALDGVDVYLAEDVDGRSGGNQDDLFEAGWNHLDGEAALRFARLRAGSDDLSRIERQSVLLAALRSRLQSPAVIPHLPELVKVFWGAVATDLTLRDLPPLLCLAGELSAGDLQFFELSRESLTSGREYSAQLGGRASVLYADPEALQNLLRDFFN